MSDLPPYAATLGLRTVHADDGDPLWMMPFRQEVIGRPGYLHGGAIAGLLEFAALDRIKRALGDKSVTIKPINITCSYLRGGTGQDTFAAATITRLGRRVANVEAFAWQGDRDKPIATAQMNLLLRR